MTETMDAPAPTTKMIGVNEVAEILECSRRKVYDLAEAHKIAHLRIGASVRFTRADVDAYLAKCRRPAATA